MLKAATIDIGSNSVKYLLVEQTREFIRPIRERVAITRLSASLNRTGILSAAAIYRTVGVIESMLAELEQLGAGKVFLIGTMALRSATNSSLMVEQVRRRTGLTIQILSGAAEAELGHLAVANSLALGERSYCIYDIGGGSTEFIIGQDEKIDRVLSLQVGVVRFTEQYLSMSHPGAEEVTACRRQIESDLQTLKDLRVDQLIGLGGTATSLAAVHRQIQPYDPQVIHGSVLTRLDLDKLSGLFLCRSLPERQKIVGLQPQRADVIIAGLLIVQVIMTYLHQEQLRVSDAGLRLGYLCRRLNQNKVVYA